MTGRLLSFKAARVHQPRFLRLRFYPQKQQEETIDAKAKGEQTEKSQPMLTSRVFPHCLAPSHAAQDKVKIRGRAGFARAAPNFDKLIYNWTYPKNKA